MGQRYPSSKTDKFEWPNGAVGFRPYSPFKPPEVSFAKIKNCPVDGIEGLRVTCYIQGPADSLTTIPACTRRFNRHIGGFVTIDDGSAVFVPLRRFRAAMTDKDAPVGRKD